MDMNLISFPEDAGLSSRGLLRYLDAVERSGLEHHTILVARHGKVAARMCFAPYGKDDPHMLFSLSKLFTSAAAGFAVQEGLLAWDTKLVDVLAKDVPENADPRLGEVTLHHLLTMPSGLEESSDRTETDAWAREVMGHAFAHAPGEWFHYNSHGTYLISKMVQTVTGLTVRDYLMPRLFAPLGIPAPDYDLSPEGVCCGGWGLHLSGESILRMGQCLLDGGRWEGKQVLPAEWLERAPKAWIDNSNGHPDPENEWHQGYGYQIWRTRGNRYRGDGAFGQICMISEEKDMAVAVTAGLKDMGGEMRLLHEYLFPAADMEPGTPEERRAFREREAALACAWPGNDDSGEIPCGTWACGEARFTLARKGRTVVLGMKEDGMTGDLLSVYGLDAPYHCNAEKGFHTQRKAGWENGELRLESRMIGGPFMNLLTIRRDGEALAVRLTGIGCPEWEKTFTRVSEA